MKSRNDALEAIEKTRQEIDDFIDNYKYDSYLAVNVKRHNDGIDLDDFKKLAGEKLAEMKKRNLELNFTDITIDSIIQEFFAVSPENHFFDKVFSEQVYELWRLWLGFERNYVKDYISIAVDTPAYIDELIEKVKKGEKIGYPLIDEKRALSGKLTELNKWKKRSEILYRIEGEQTGFCGRSGGYYILCKRSIFDAILEELDDLERSDIDYKAKDLIKEVKGVIKKTHELMESISMLADEMKAYNKALKFSDEIAFRIEETIESMLPDDSKQYTVFEVMKA